MSSPHPRIPAPGSPSNCRPSYLDLGDAELDRRREQALQELEDCRACPRRCGVDRVAGKWAAYNTSAYDVVEALQLMEGLVDIYMPDFKYWTPERSRTYMKAEDYPEFARDAVKEMHRQVGGLITDGEGLARRGLIVRHLVMPGQLDETEAILTWVARELGLRNLDERRPHRKLRMLRMV